MMAADAAEGRGEIMKKENVSEQPDQLVKEIGNDAREQAYARGEK